MHELIIVGVPLFVLILLMAARVPVGVALAASGALGIVLVTGDLGRAESTMASLAYTTVSNHALVLIPMFILMGLFVSHAGILNGIFDVANRVVGRLPGGLAISAIMGSTIFGGISGSSSADVATIGRMSIGEMSKRGYDTPYSAAVLASAATVANLIPPSIVLVLYGIMTQESIGGLLLAGILPGLLMIGVFIFLVIFLAIWRQGRGRGGRHPDNIVSASVHDTTTKVASRRRESLFAAVTFVVLFGTVVGGIYSGVFTATEAGAAAAVLALVAALIFPFLSGPKGWWSRVRTTVKRAVMETGSLSAMIFMLVIGSTIFTQYLVLARIPSKVSDWVLSLNVEPVVVVLLLFAILVVMGMIIDGLSLLIIVTPIAYPVVTGLGFDGIWFGVIMIMAIEIGLLTPPVGLNVFVVSGLIPGMKAETVYRRVLPFIIGQFIVVGLLIMFPEIVTFLPETMR